MGLLKEPTSGLSRFRQRLRVFRLLHQEFRRRIENMVNRNYRSLAAAWRSTVETWLRRQGLITIRPRPHQNSVNHFSQFWAHKLGVQAIPGHHRQTQWHHQRPQPPRRPPVRRSLYWVGHRRQPGNCEDREELASVGKELSLGCHARHRIPKDRSASMLPSDIVPTGQVGNMSASSSSVCRPA
jgi:hypothetical protein